MIDIAKPSVFLVCSFLSFQLCFCSLVFCSWLSNKRERERKNQNRVVCVKLKKAFYNFAGKGR